MNMYTTAPRTNNTSLIAFNCITKLPKIYFSLQFVRRYYSKRCLLIRISIALVLLNYARKFSHALMIKIITTNYSKINN